MRDIDFWRRERDEATKIECGLKVRIYETEVNGTVRPAMQVWRGRARKPFINNYYPTAMQRDARLQSLIRAEEEAKDEKLRRKAERQGTPDQVASVTVGSIFHHSWGWEQTQCDYYQVTEIKGRMLTLRRIGSESIRLTSGMSDMRMPIKDAFLEDEKPMRKLLQFSGGEAYVSMEFGWCSIWDGKEKYCSWYA